MHLEPSVTERPRSEASRSGTPPGPPPRKGLLDSLYYYYSFYRDAIGTVGARFEKYGDIYYAPSNGVGLYVLRHPEHIWQVLVRDAAKYTKKHTAFDILARFLGYGLLTTDGDVWRRQRRMVQPAFAHKRLEGYSAMMVDEALKIVDGWRDGEERDVSREMMELTLRVVNRTLFSHDVRGQTDEVRGAMAAFANDIGRPNIIPKWLPNPQRQRAEQGIAALDRIIYGMIAARRNGGTAPEPPDLLHMLLSAVDVEGDGGKLDDREIRDQLVTLFLAGHETTSNALSWTWHLLSQHPEAETKLHAELAAVLGGRAPTYADLEQLPYTRQVFDEAMRLYPPAFTLARLAEEDTEIGGYRVPAGSEVVVWVYHAHHDARWFPEPEAFRPERFAPEEVAKRPKLAYLPFGAGARACIGKMFALIEGQLLLAALAQRYRFERVPGPPVSMRARITLAPKNGLTMRLVRRDPP